MTHFNTIKIKFKTMFSKNKIRTLKHLLELIEVTKEELKVISSEDLEKKINDNLRPKVKFFGERKVFLLAKMLLGEEEPSNIEVSKEIQKALSESETIELEINEDGELLEEVCFEIPTRTLFLNTSVLKGEVPFTLIEDCIIDVDDTFEDDPLYASVIELVKYIQRNGWPCETPICISKTMQSAAPAVVIELSKIADLIIQ